MVRLRIALGVASSLVAVAALTIVFAGSGEAQGNGNGQPNGPNVTVVNTPLPVTGNVTATMTGSVNAIVTGQVTVNNPSNNPVLIRDVDAQGAKELWQKTTGAPFLIGEGEVNVLFDPVPAGKALVIEHVNIFYEDFANPGITPTLVRIRGGFSGLNLDNQFLRFNRPVRASWSITQRSSTWLQTTVSKPTCDATTLPGSQACSLQPQGIWSTIRSVEE